MATDNSKNLNRGSGRVAAPTIIGPKGFDTFYLGADERCHISTNTEETKCNNNVVVVGGTGSGKTFSTVAPTLLHLLNSNFIGVFTKRNLLDAIAEAKRAQGYTVYILDLAEPDCSEYGFDPLRYCRNRAEIRDLAHTIIKSTSDHPIKSDFWESAAENLLDAALYVATKTTDRERPMAAALRLLDGLTWKHRHEWEIVDPCWGDNEVKRWYDTAPYQIMERLTQDDPAARSQWNDFSNIKADGQGCGVTSSVAGPLYNTFTESVRKCLVNPAQFDFRSLLKPRTALFVRTSPVDEANQRFTTLFYKQAFKSLFELGEAQAKKALPYPVHVFCDDFATGSPIAGFDKLISIFREKGISATLLLQSESQLASIYGERAATTIINNCDTYVYMGGMDDATCYHVARRAKVPVDEIFELPTEMMYLFRRGQKPIRTKRYQTLDDDVYQREIAEKEIPVPPLHEACPDKEVGLYDLFRIKEPEAFHEYKKRRDTFRASLKGGKPRGFFGEA